MAFRAVIFDLGGVVLGSPLHAIRDYERERGIARNAINRVVRDTGPGGAWSRLERGELEMETFFAAFEADCAAHGIEICARTMMQRMGEASEPRPAMLEAIRRIRAEGLAAAALTNNWVTENPAPNPLVPHFDQFFESSVLGMRKPDPRIYHHACGVLGVEPGHAVFLDDIGANLKPARALGMTTVKVDEPGAALAELGELLGFPLAADPPGSGSSS